MTDAERTITSYSAVPLAAFGLRYIPLCSAGYHEKCQKSEATSCDWLAKHDGKKNCRKLRLRIEVIK